jgi:tRNA pseudouridine55 synthase
VALDRSAGPDGVLLLDKPAGITSTRALAKAKRLLGSLKGGHTGTLDPFATGLLPLVFGEATKFSRFLIDARKSYQATLRLGEETETGDIESPVGRRSPVEVESRQIADVLAGFVGVQSQVPPMHSAVHVHGRRLYEYARAGEEVVRPIREIEIDEVRALEFDGRDLTILVTCSKGTYIRTLGQDVGRELGCGAHLVGLRRLAVGGFQLADAATFEELEGLGRAAALARLLAPEVLVASLARFDATAEEADDFVHGRMVHRRAGDENDEVAVYAPEGRFLGVGLCAAAERIAPLRLMATADAKSPDFA